MAYVVNASDENLVEKQMAFCIVHLTKIWMPDVLKGNEVTEISKMLILPIHTNLPFCFIGNVMVTSGQLSTYFAPSVALLDCSEV